MLKIQRLALAIAEQEGWLTPKEAGNNCGSRSWRNNNPGNLRTSPLMIGTDGGFAVFKTENGGFAALEWDLTQKAKGNTSTGLGPKSTLRELIFKWAPPSDSNNSEAYLTNIIKMTGFPESTQLTSLLD